MLHGINGINLRVNTDNIPPHMCFIGWNAVAYEHAHMMEFLKLLQEKMREEKRYDIADAIREELKNVTALEYVGVSYEVQDE